MLLCRHLPVLALSCVLGCTQDPQVPKFEQDPVSISLSVSTQTLRPGGVDTIRVVAVNNLEQNVRLSFSSACQVFVTIRNQAGAVVVPRAGRQCAPVQSQLAIPIGGRQTYTTIWKGGFDFEPEATPTRVPPGAYFVSATLTAIGYSTLAPAFKIDVVPVP